MNTSATTSTTKKAAIAICCLTRGYRKSFMYDALIRRNQYIKRTILDSIDANISMLIFHEGNISKAHQKYIARQSAVPNLTFVSVEDEFKHRAVLQSNTYCHPTEYSEKFTYGYKCMCAFWMDGFFKYIQEYDYILRIDEDCMITRMPLDDLIRRMEAREFSYVAALNFGSDSEECTVGLMRFSQDFCLDNGLNAEKTNINNCPYTNVFLMDLGYYRNSTVVARFSQAVRDSDSIFINRWGDHVLWRAMISMHSGDECFFDKRIEYYHGSHFCVVKGGQSDRATAPRAELNLRTVLLYLHALPNKTRRCLSKMRTTVRRA